MPWQVILPIAANIIQGAVGHSMAASSAARENNRQAHLANLRRQELQPIIDRLQEARNYFGVEEQLSRDFTRASDQMAAQSAQSGMTNAGSGGLDQQRSDMLGSMLAELAQFKVQDEQQRQQFLAQLLSDPNLYAGEGERQNPGTAALLGALGGGVAGAGSILNSFVSTEEGLAALGSLFGAGDGSGAVMALGDEPRTPPARVPDPPAYTPLPGVAPANPADANTSQQPLGSLRASDGAGARGGQSRSSYVNFYTPFG